MKIGIVGLYNDIRENFSDRDKQNQEKFMASLIYADDQSKKVLDQYEVKITKGSQLKTLTIDPKTLTQALELSEKMGFRSAYDADPTRLCQPVTNIIKRMAKCDALGIPYKDEEGRIAGFIFRERLFNERMKALDLEKEAEEIQTEVEVNNNLSVDMDKLISFAIRVLEEFGMEDEKDIVLNRLHGVASSGFGYKESLMEVFKVYGGDVEFLSGKIDEILATDKELKMAV